MDEKYFIGIDSGTSNIKTVLFDKAGNVVDCYSYELTVIIENEGFFEESMDEIWSKCSQGLKEIFSRHTDKHIVGIGITAQGDGLWLLDKEFKPLGNGICFCDGRAIQEINQWKTEGVLKKIHEKTATYMFTGNQNAILKWIDNNDKERASKIGVILHLKDYLFYKLTGQLMTDKSDQSLAFINLDTEDYDDEIFKLCELENYRQFYPKIQEDKYKCRLDNNIFKNVNHDQIYVTNGPMDVSACALGSGVIEVGQCCTILGTAALHEMVIDNPRKKTSLSGMTVKHVGDSIWLRLMASLAGTPNIDWLVHNLRSDYLKSNKKIDFNTLEKHMNKVPIGAKGIIYHPFLLSGGERAPFVNAKARASILGLSVNHSFADIARAVYEGITYAMRDCYEAFNQEISSITLCGGGSQSEFWCQMIADVLNREVKLVYGDELGALGTVIHNMVVQKVYPSYKDAVENIVKVKKTYKPNLENHIEYTKYYKLYKQSYAVMPPIWESRFDTLHEGAINDKK